MATTDNVWSFDLDEFSVTKDVLNDFVARVRTRGSLTIADIATLICEERTEYRPETIENIQKLVDEKIRQMVRKGFSVVTGTANYLPTITGVFIGTKGDIDPNIHKCEVSITPSNAMRREVAKVKPEFSGRAKSAGGARIALVKDVITDRVDGFITPGGQLDVSGIKIRCLGADGKSAGSIKLINNETDATAATITSLAINDPSRLIFVVPADLAKGVYRMEMETYFSTPTTVLKKPRTLVYETLLTAGQEPTPDEGGGDDVLE